MWKCPNCKMTKDTYKCKNCGLDESKAYTHHRTITWLTQDRTGFSFGSPASACSARESIRKNDCRTSRKIPGEQERKQYALAVQELAALGEDQYQLKIWEDETIDPDIKTGIVPHEWLSFAAIAGNREAQLQLSGDYSEASSKNETFVKVCCFF